MLRLNSSVILMLLGLQLILIGCSGGQQQDRRSLTTSSWAGTIGADERKSVIKVTGEALLDGPVTDDVRIAAIINGLRQLADKLESPTCNSDGDISTFTSHYSWDNLDLYAIKIVSDGLVCKDSIAVTINTPESGKSEDLLFRVKNMKLLQFELGKVDLNRVRQLLEERGIKLTSSQRFGGNIWQQELAFLTLSNQGQTL